MRIESEASYDAVVIGGGIAGCVAAIEASRAGASVCLASSGGSFSGSSFYPGTWGLGLVGPIDASDADDLMEAIVRGSRRCRCGACGIVRAGNSRRNLDA